MSISQTYFLSFIPILLLWLFLPADEWQHAFFEQFHFISNSSHWLTLISYNVGGGMAVIYHLHKRSCVNSHTLPSQDILSWSPMSKTCTEDKGQVTTSLLYRTEEMKFQATKFNWQVSKWIYSLVSFSGLEISIPVLSGTGVCH